MTEIQIRNIMKTRGFSFEKKFDECCACNAPVSYIFVKDSDVDRYAEQIPLVEIYEDGRYHIFYKQNFMVGFMDSGEFGMIEDHVTFKKIYDRFNNQVKILRDNLKNES